ncbi:lamin tail domain-containing protein [Aegicerativicinus sediminis]|uniref:lamin tail domain-containing protein n=1 Tax=Aegicerativicinus sediminis TaxID=2893202 RepID=UPI001E2D8E09|nr:lamin tail domain-containing protein [Aegicerativicinus sediminis]
MNRFLPLSLLLFLISVTSGFPQSKIIISQYIDTETGTTPKGIELFNVSNSYIAFSPTNKLEIYRGLNGGPCQQIISIDNGILYQNEVMVFGTNDVINYATTNGTDLSSAHFYNFTFNGNDAIEIYLGGVLQDQFGTCGMDPGNYWQGSGVKTADQNIAIKNGLCVGDPDGWLDPSERFTTISSTPSINLTGMGTAPQACTIMNPTIIALPNQLIGFSYFENSGPSNAQNLTIEGFALTTDLVINAPTNFEISLDPNTNFTQNLSFSPIANKVSKRTIYIRLKSGLPPNTYTETIGLSSNGVNINVPLEGRVYNPLANLVITELMYNTTGSFDDEWIEICNPTLLDFNISGYQVKINNVLTFTFPANSIISNESCITLNIGDGGGTEFNIDCPFTPTYGNPTGTDRLTNSTGKTISLVANDNLTNVDEVTYNPQNGADGNGSSLHVIDINLNNSITSYNWQEVRYGGSPGLNSLTSQCAPTTPEINVEGNLGAFPDIPNGDTTPSGLDNTLFAGQFVGSSQTKSYRIQNLGGADLTINNINITGQNSGDFAVTLNPDSVIAPGEITNFEITFSPSSIGPRTATVSISNNDSDENPYKFTVGGTGLCYESSNTISPTSGPVGTVVNVVGTNLIGATAKIGNIEIVPTYINNTSMELAIPDSAVTSTLIITDNKGCVTSFVFEVLEEHRSGCEGNTFLSELFISEVTDATYGGLSYIEIYNPTEFAINLSTYSIRIFFNGNSNFDEQPLNGLIQPGDVFVLSAGIDSPLAQNKNCNSILGGKGELADQSSTVLEGINKTDFGHDFIGLYNAGTLIDAFGVQGDNSWMDSLPTTISGDSGFNFRRFSTANPLPSNSFNPLDWLIIDWMGSKPASCSNNDYSNIGIHDYSSGVPPTISSQPSLDENSCELNQILSVETEEGFTGGNALNYQWFVLATNASVWESIDSSDIDYSGQQTSELIIGHSYLKNGYQYYVQVMEEDMTCYKISNAVRINSKATIWDGTNWSKGQPNLESIAIIDSDYNSTVEGSFSACQLVVKDGNSLFIENTKHIEVENNIWIYGSDLNNYGEIIVRTGGSVLQNNGKATTNLIGTGKITVEKVTAPANNWYEYTYWSSPMSNETVGQGLAEANPNRRYILKGENYLDALAETNNNNTYSPGQDGIDDDGNDWIKVSAETVMQPGVGYAATQNPQTFGSLPGSTLPIQLKYTFNGILNNGNYNIPVYRNDSELADDNWNFIGNPYPSAVDALKFLDVNSGTLDGAIYLWSQNTAPSSTANGNQALNFTDSDYAIINGSGALAGGDGIIPDMFIPSCQGFFITYSNNGFVNSLNGNIAQGTVIFNNEMRSVEGSANSKFFRTRSDEKEFLRLDLTTESKVFSQILVSFLNGATEKLDPIYYDFPRKKITYGNIYTFAKEDTTPLAIQGRGLNSLNEDSEIAIGFSTYITDPTIFKLSLTELKGTFLSSHPVILKDNLKGIIHDLTQSDYYFTSEKGNFNDRFSIVFANNLLNNEEVQANENSIYIHKLNHNWIEIGTDKETISNIVMTDLLGRTILEKKANQNAIQLKTSTETGIYVFKISLLNGSTILKRVLLSY